MSSSKDFAQFITENIRPECEVTLKKMFGEYCLYSRKKVVALICNNQLFVKPTESGRKFIGEVVEGKPFSRANPYFLIEEKAEDFDWLSDLFLEIWDELPEKKVKKKKM